MTARYEPHRDVVFQLEYQAIPIDNYDRRAAFASAGHRLTLNLDVNY